MRLHSGISAGLIVTGTEDRRDGTFGVTGDAVNTGARLAAHAEADTVLVSEEIQRIIADYFQTEPLAPVELKGKAGRVTPYRVAGQTGIASRFEAAAQRGFTAYAGRETELALLTAALAKTRQGQGQFVTVMGEPGIGKSRLLFEFRHSVPRDEVSVLTGLLPELRHGYALPAHGGCARARAAPGRGEKCRRAGRSHRRCRAGHLPGAGALSARSTCTCSRSRARRTRSRPRCKAMRCAAPSKRPWPAIITENARHQPMVLIYEDWHWADEASDSALKHLCGLIPHHALQVIVTYRPEYERKWAHPQNYHPLVLQPLGVEDTRRHTARSMEGEQPSGWARRAGARAHRWQCAVQRRVRAGTGRRRQDHGDRGPCDLDRRFGRPASCPTRCTRWSARASTVSPPKHARSCAWPR